MAKFRLLAYILVLLSVVLSLGCIRDHVRGTTKPPSIRGGSLLDPISRDQAPKDFSTAMAANWMIALLPGALGLLLLSVVKRQDVLDP